MKEDLRHNYDLSIKVNDDTVSVERSTMYGEKGQGEDGGFDCAGTFGCAGSFGGTLGSVGTFGCCC